LMSVTTHSQNVSMKTDVKSAIYALENKKKPVLAHEFGFGSPCRKCGEKCPGLELHFWRKICMQCKCGKEDHDIVVENVDPGQFRIGRLFQKQTDASYNSESRLQQLNSTSAALENFEWTPPNSVSASLSEKFMFTLPKEFRPIKGTEGAVRRRQALERQLPLHDLDINAASHAVDQCERVNMEKFLTSMKLRNVGQGAVKEFEHDMQFHKFENCFSCKSAATPGEVIVVADRFGPNVFWHPMCFRCSVCNEYLADLIYFYKNGKIFCGRHFGESLCARCAGCDEVCHSCLHAISVERRSQPTPIELNSPASTGMLMTNVFLVPRVGKLVPKMNVYIRVLIELWFLWRLFYVNFAEMHCVPKKYLMYPYVGDKRTDATGQKCLFWGGHNTLPISAQTELEDRCTNKCFPRGDIFTGCYYGYRLTIPICIVSGNRGEIMTSPCFFACEDVDETCIPMIKRAPRSYAGNANSPIPIECYSHSGTQCLSEYKFCYDEAGHLVSCSRRHGFFPPCLFVCEHYHWSCAAAFFGLTNFKPFMYFLASENGLVTRFSQQCWGLEDARSYYGEDCMEFNIWSKPAERPKWRCVENCAFPFSRGPSGKVPDPLPVFYTNCLSEDAVAYYFRKMLTKKDKTIYFPKRSTVNGERCIVRGDNPGMCMMSIVFFSSMFSVPWCFIAGNKVEVCYSICQHDMTTCITPSGFAYTEADDYMQNWADTGEVDHLPDNEKRNASAGGFLLDKRPAVWYSGFKNTTYNGISCEPWRDVLANFAADPDFGAKNIDGSTVATLYNSLGNRCAQIHHYNSLGNHVAYLRSPLGPFCYVKLDSNLKTNIHYVPLPCFPVCGQTNSSNIMSFAEMHALRTLLEKHKGEEALIYLQFSKRTTIDGEPCSELCHFSGLQPGAYGNSHLSAETAEAYCRVGMKMKRCLLGIDHPLAPTYETKGKLKNTAYLKKLYNVTTELQFKDFASSKSHATFKIGNKTRLIQKMDLIQDGENMIFCRSADDLMSDYRGKIAVTVNGHSCQYWAEKYPHSHQYGAGHFGDETIAEVMNYCRNPDKSSCGPWCFTTDPKVIREPCFHVCASKQGEEHTGCLPKHLLYKKSLSFVWQHNKKVTVSNKPCNFSTIIRSEHDVFARKMCTTNEKLEIGPVCQPEDSSLLERCFIACEDADLECIPRNEMLVYDYKGNRKTSLSGSPCLDWNYVYNVFAELPETTTSPLKHFWNRFFYHSNSSHYRRWLDMISTVSYVGCLNLLTRVSSAKDLLRFFPENVDTVIFKGPICFTNKADFLVPEPCFKTCEDDWVDKKDCLPKHKKQDVVYFGYKNVTVSGRPCRMWDKGRLDILLPWELSGPHHNYCRNYGKEKMGPWCYVEDRNIVREACFKTCADKKITEEMMTSYTVRSWKKNPCDVNSEIRSFCCSYAAISKTIEDEKNATANATIDEPPMGMPDQLPEEDEKISNALNLIWDDPSEAIEDAVHTSAKSSNLPMIAFILYYFAHWMIFLLHVMYLSNEPDVAQMRMKAAVREEKKALKIEQEKLEKGGSTVKEKKKRRRSGERRGRNRGSRHGKEGRRKKESRRKKLKDRFKRRSRSKNASGYFKVCLSSFATTADVTRNQTVGVIVLFSAVSIHILPLNGVLRSNGCQQAITFHSPHFNPNSCFLSLTCDASFPPHFSYTPTKNIVPLPARMTYPNAAMKGVPQNDLLISCWCSTVCHVASSTTVSPFPTPEIQHYMLQLRQQTAVTSALLNNRLAFLKAAADKSVV
ncbi:Testin, partial [Trichinella pseudospiralis]